MNERKTQTKTNGGTTSADIQHNKWAIEKYLWHRQNKGLNSVLDHPSQLWEALSANYNTH